MSPPHDTINGGWAIAAANAVSATYGWLFADMPGISIIGGVLAALIAVFKLLDLVRAWRASDRSQSMHTRLKSTFGTRPAPLGDDR